MEKINLAVLSNGSIRSICYSFTRCKEQQHVFPTTKAILNVCMCGQMLWSRLRTSLGFFFFFLFFWSGRKCSLWNTFSAVWIIHYMPTCKARYNRRVFNWPSLWAKGEMSGCFWKQKVQPWDDNSEWQPMINTKYSPWPADNKSTAYKKCCSEYR